jgi:dimethylpropiothetin dethiomethylase
MSDRIDVRFRALIDAVRDNIQTKTSDPDAANGILNQVDKHLAGFQEVQSAPTPSRLPACRHLPIIFSLAKHTTMAFIASAFEVLEPDLEWVQNPNYSDEYLGAGYMDNYAYCDFIGPRGMAPAVDFAAGFLLLGPHRLYPDHRHAATEVYCVVAGTADWRSADCDWEEQPPGSFIYHPPWTIHATRCNQEPLLALYFWLGDVTQAADLV